MLMLKLNNKPVLAIIRLIVFLLFFISYLASITVFTSEAISINKGITIQAINKNYDFNEAIEKAKKEYGFVYLCQKIKDQEIEIKNLEKKILHQSNLYQSNEKQIEELLNADLNTTVKTIINALDKPIQQELEKIETIIEQNKSQYNQTAFKEIQGLRQNLIKKTIIQFKSINYKDTLPSFTSLYYLKENEVISLLDKWSKHNDYNENISPLLKERLKLRNILFTFKEKLTKKKDEIKKISEKKQRIINIAFLSILFLNAPFALKLVKLFYFISNVIASSIIGRKVSI